MAKSNWNFVFAVVAGFIILWLVYDRESLKSENKQLKKDIEEDQNLDAETKRRLQSLIESNPDLDEDIKAELTSIAALVDIKKETKAILSLAKIIENLLKRLFAEDQSFKNWLKVEKRKLDFSNLIEYAKVKGIIQSESYHHLHLLREIRNKEAHELNVKKEKIFLVSAFISGVGTILAICQLLKKRDGPRPVQTNSNSSI